MPPLLLLLLLFAFLPLASSLQDCHGHTVCLHIVTCYDDSMVNPGERRPLPNVSVAAQDLSKAVEKIRENCDGIGVISTLAIVASFSSLNVSFETDLRYAEIFIGKPEDLNYLRFHTGDGSQNLKINGLEGVLEVTKRAPIEAYGRTTYSFQLEHPSKKRFQAFIGTPFSFKTSELPIVYTLDNELIEMKLFLKQLKDNLACDVDLVKDACRDRTQCHQAIISGHSVNCTSPGQLQVKKNNEDWKSMKSISCKDQQWAIIKPDDLPIDFPDAFEVRCYEPATTTTTTPAAPTTTPMTSNATATPSAATTDVVMISPKTMPTASAPNETVAHPDPIHQTARNGSTVAPDTEPRVEGKGKSKDDKITGLLNNKWMWIGIGAAFLAIIAIGNVIGCILCRRKQGGESKASVKKVEKKRRSEKSPKRNKKKKSAKQKKDDESSSAQPESSESKVEVPEKTVERKPLMQKSLHPTVSSDATVNYLDRLKTEDLN